MNYSKLQSVIADFLNRTDLSAVIPTFIQLTESRINRTIRARRMELRVTATISSQFSSLPDDFLEMRNIQINSNPVTALEYVTPQYADKLRQGSIAGKPRFFSVLADRLELIPAPQEEIIAEMVYYQRVPALSNASPTNWLLEINPDIYLYGALVQAAIYLKDDPSLFGSLFDSALEEIITEDAASQFHGTTPTMRGICIG